VEAALFIIMPARRSEKGSVLEVEGKDQFSNASTTRRNIVSENEIESERRTKMLEILRRRCQKRVRYSLSEKEKAKGVGHDSTLTRSNYYYH
jgi:hypothetical protein